MSPMNESSPFVSSPLYEKGGRSFSKKKLLLVVGMVLILGATGIVTVLVMRGSGSDNKTPEAAAIAISDKVADVAIEPAGYTPATISIKKGQQITWTNNTTQPRRLTADQESLPGFDTDDPLNQGDSYTYTFTKSGSFRYYDPDSPTAYVGTINVQ